MTPGTYDLTIYRGDTYRWKFVLWEDDEKTIPADLTSVTVKAEIRDKPDGLRVTPIDCVVQLPNIVLATLTAANSKTIQPTATSAWDLQLTNAAGDVSTVLAGKVKTTLDITAEAGTSKSVVR